MGLTPLLSAQTALLRQGGHRSPGAVGFGAVGTGVDEGHSDVAIADIGIFRAVALERFSGIVGADIGLEAAVQACKGIMERLGVAAGDGWLGHQVCGQVLEEAIIGGDAVIAPIGAVGLAIQVDMDALGVFLLPDQGSLFATDLDAEIVFVADGNLGSADQCAAVAVTQFAIGGEVVIEWAALDHDFKMGGDVGDVQTGHVAQLHERMGADIAAAATASGRLGVDTPDIQRLGQPSLQVGGIDPAYIAQEAAGDDVACKTGGPVAQIRMSQAEGDLLFFHDLDQLHGFIRVQGDRLFTEDRDACADGFVSGVKVDMVGGYDQYVVQLFACGRGFLRLDHGVIGFITLDGVGPVCGFFQGHFGVWEECAGRDTACAVEVDCFLMGLHNESAFTAANQTNI